MCHTPGPWRTTTAYDDPAVIDYDGRIIAMAVMDEDDPQELETIVANARLLAAAPELLAACREAVSAITYLLSNDDDDPNYADTLNTLAAAISKAEGRSE